MQPASDNMPDMELEDIAPRLSELLGMRLVAAERIGGGANSRVYRLTCETGSGEREFAIKLSFHHPADERDRLGVEYSALRFMWDNGMRCVPEPIFLDREGGYAVYEYIRGEEIPAETVSEAEIDQAVAFLSWLDEYKNHSDSANFGGASEACFSFHMAVRNIQARLDALRAVAGRGDSYDALNIFLERHFSPIFKAFQEWCMDYAARERISFYEELDLNRRTLSPSDFGFHNALRREGKPVFLDFEYFGWDDPAKMLVDFLLHPAPAMQIPEHLRRGYTEGLLSHFHKDPELVHRTRVVYPLFGLKWIMIILNEFLPDRISRRAFARRAFARGDAGEFEKLQMAQLEKAERRLEFVLARYDRFPYL